MKVHVARWQTEWGSENGTLGVYSTDERAWDELRRCAPGYQHTVEAFELDYPGALVVEAFSVPAASR